MGRRRRGHGSRRRSSGWTRSRGARSYVGRKETIEVQRIVAVLPVGGAGVGIRRRWRGGIELADFVLLRASETECFTSKEDPTIYIVLSARISPSTVPTDVLYRFSIDGGNSPSVSQPRLLLLLLLLSLQTPASPNRLLFFERRHVFYFVGSLRPPS